MQKVVNGKRYNTETATLICEYSFSHFGDFKYVQEELYITKNGNYFIAGEGGPLTCYAKSLGNNSTGGSSEIRPLEKMEAFEWAQDYGDAEKVFEFFSDLAEEA